ncbi:MAG TPA: signal peptide peptidase SppA [Burkholderiaceae bacterium]|nr:signal peptide peptidase SppA [Burkholderiaceae bacterium]
MADRPGFFRRFFGGLWSFLNFTRQLIFNVLFFGIVAVLLVAWFTGDGLTAVGPDTALVLNLQGEIVEEYTIGPREAAVAEALGEQRFETRVRDVLAALDDAAKDPQITRAVLVLDEMRGAGIATLREIGAALERFKAAGKPVYAWGENFAQGQYYLASHANELYLHPGGIIAVRGLEGTRGYYKTLLDKLGVKVNAFQAGRYKSFSEPFTRNEPTPEAKEADALLLNGLWTTWTADVERVRKLKPGTVDAVIADLPQRLAAAQGDIARLALNEKFVDGLKTRSQFREQLLQSGAPRSEDDSETFRQVSLYAYARHTRQPLGGDAVGVIVAQGEITNGDAQQGRVGARTMAELIQRAREDDAIKAVVLRIDSPGGLVQASELIREQLDLTRKAGKPVVASMGDVAASGGYWIAMGADEVVADDATITGSIGVFGLLPTFEGTMEKLGINVDGVSTTWLAGATDLRRPVDKRLVQTLELVVNSNYREFIGLVAERRNSTPEKINEVAQGRVWTGAQAKERGLVDSLGGIDVAIKSAARRANLGERYRLEYVEPEPRGLSRYLALLFGRVTAAVKSGLGFDGMPALGSGGAVKRDLQLLFGARDNPLAGISYCFCSFR